MLLSMLSSAAYVVTVEPQVAERSETSEARSFEKALNVGRPFEALQYRDELAAEASEASGEVLTHHTETGIKKIIANISLSLSIDGACMWPAAHSVLSIGRPF